MSQKWRKYSPEFRRDAVEKIKTCANVTQLARELGIRRKWLYQWKDDAAGGHLAPPVEADSKGERKVKDLEALVARQSLELDFFKGALQRIEEQRRKRGETSGPGSTSKSAK
jgi:transposase-like protein